MILYLSIILAIITATFYTLKAAKYSNLVKGMILKLSMVESKNILEAQILEELHNAHLESKSINRKLKGELEYWKLRRKLMEKVQPSSFRKKKIRGKRRKGKRRVFS